MTPLDKLKAMPIYGDAHSDRPRFDAANEIIHDTTATLEDRLAALNEIDRTMGIEGQDPINEQALADYIAEYEV